VAWGDHSEGQAGDQPVYERFNLEGHILIDERWRLCDHPQGLPWLAFIDISRKVHRSVKLYIRSN
jgi:hypothetical protein